MLCDLVRFLNSELEMRKYMENKALYGFETDALFY